MSNRFVLVPREEVHSSIDGVDFGGRCYVIARSPKAVLLWVMSHSSSINGHQRYHGPCMMLLSDRTMPAAKCYKRITEDVPLSHMVMFMAWDKLKPVFGEDAYPWVSNAVNPHKHGRRTLLIEGGGPVLMPSRYYGEAAYLRWRDLPAEDRGFLLPAAAKERDRHSFGYREEMG